MSHSLMIDLLPSGTIHFHLQRTQGRMLGLATCTDHQTFCLSPACSLRASKARRVRPPGADPGPVLRPRTEPASSSDGPAGPLGPFRRAEHRHANVSSNYFPGLRSETKDLQKQAFSSHRDFFPVFADTHSGRIGICITPLTAFRRSGNEIKFFSGLIVPSFWKP